MKALALLSLTLLPLALSAARAGDEAAVRADDEAAVATSAPLAWLDDLGLARAVAAERDRPILLVFR